MKTDHKLTNLDIFNQYKNDSFHLMIDDFKGAFAYWAASLNHNNNPTIDIPLKAYEEYLTKRYFIKKDTVLNLKYSEIEKITSEEVFCNIPEVLALNEMKPDFISLGAFSRNVFYHILRQQITQPIN